MWGKGVEQQSTTKEKGHYEQEDHLLTMCVLLRPSRSLGEARPHLAVVGEDAAAEEEEGDGKGAEDDLELDREALVEGDDEEGQREDAPLQAMAMGTQVTVVGIQTTVGTQVTVVGTRVMVVGTRVMVGTQVT